MPCTRNPSLGPALGRRSLGVPCGASARQQGGARASPARSPHSHTHIDVFPSFACSCFPAHPSIVRFLHISEGSYQTHSSGALLRAHTALRGSAHVISCKLLELRPLVDDRGVDPWRLAVSFGRALFERHPGVRPDGAERGTGVPPYCQPRPEEESVASESPEGPLPQAPLRSRFPSRPGARPTTRARGTRPGSRRARSGRPDSIEEAAFENNEQPRHRARSLDTKGRGRDGGGGPMDGWVRLGE